MQLVYRFRCKASVLPVPLADHTQRGCLYASYRIRAPSGGYGQCLRAVDAHQPVRLAACLCRQIQVVIFMPVLQFLQSLADGGVRKRAYPQAAEGQRTARIGIQVSEYQFPFACAVRCHYYAVALVPQFRYHLYLFHRCRVRLVALVRLYLAGYQHELLRYHRQAVPAESLEAVALRQGRLYQMPQCPCHMVAVSCIKSFFLSCCSGDACYLTRHARFFCQYGNHTFSVLIIDTFVPCGVERGTPVIRGICGTWRMRPRFNPLFILL